MTVLFLLLAAGVAAYACSQRNSRRVVEKVREATPETILPNFEKLYLDSHESNGVSRVSLILPSSLYIRSDNS